MTIDATAQYETYADLPRRVAAAAAAARDARFTKSCLPQQGRLLQVLAGGVGAGRIGETGTGHGVGLAWLASTAHPGAQLFSVERDQCRAQQARQVFADEPRVRIRCGDWRELAEEAPFDLLVLDGGGQGKGDEPPLEPAEWVRPGGVVVLDDFTPGAGWPPRVGGMLDEARLYWLEHPRLRTAEVRVTPTAASLVATYIGSAEKITAIVACPRALEVAVFGVVATEPGLRIPVTHRAPIQAVAGAQTADGRGLVVTVGGDGMIRSWDATSGTAAGFRVPCGDTRIGLLGVAEAGGTRLVVCADHTAVRRFDLTSGRAVGDPLRAPGSEWLPAGGLGPAAILARPGAALLVAGAVGGQVCRWDAATGEPVGRRWTGDTGRLLAITALVLPDGRAVIVTGNNDGVVQRWDAATGEPIGAALRGRGRPVTALTWAPGSNGREVLIAQEYLGPLHRWDAVTGEPIGAMPHRAGGVSEGGLAVTPDGRVLFCVDHSGTPWRWDLTLPEPAAERLAVTTTPVNAVAVVPSAQGWLCVTGEEKGTLRRWDTTGQPVGDDLIGHPASVQNLLAVPASSASGGRTILVSAGRDGARCWDAATGEPAGDPPAPLPVGDGLAAAWLPDARLILATGTEDGIERRNALTGDDAVVDPTGEATVWDVATGTLPDGRPFFAGGTADGSVYLVDAATGEAVRPPLHDFDSQVLAVAVATLPGGTVMLAAGGEDKTILRWDAVTGDRIGEPLLVPEWWVMRLAFHPLPDNRMLLVAVDDAGAVHRWDAVTGERVGEPLPADGASRTPLRLDDVVPAHVMAVSRDEVVRCWDVLTGRHLADTTDAESALTATLPDGRVLLVVGHMDGSITITPLTTRD